MPLAKIHVVEGRYDDDRIAKVSGAVQAALMNTLRVPPEDFYQLIFEFPKKRFLHTPSFVGMHYTDDLIILDLTFIEGRSKETRLALLKDVNTRVAAAARVSPDDLMITLYEAPGENFSFGRGEAQRANAVPREPKSHASSSFDFGNPDDRRFCSRQRTDASSFATTAPSLPALAGAGEAPRLLGGAKQRFRLVDAFLLLGGRVGIGDDAGAGLNIHVAVLDQRGAQHDAG